MSRGAETPSKSGGGSGPCTSGTLSTQQGRLGQADVFPRHLFGTCVSEGFVDVCRCSIHGMKSAGVDWGLVI